MTGDQEIDRRLCELMTRFTLLMEDAVAIGRDVQARRQSETDEVPAPVLQLVGGTRTISRTTGQRSHAAPRRVAGPRKGA